MIVFSVIPAQAGIHFALLNSHYIANDATPEPGVDDALVPAIRGNRVFTDLNRKRILMERGLPIRTTAKVDSASSPRSGAIGFDWVSVDQGGVSRLISWPRKKLIKQ